MDKLWKCTCGWVHVEVKLEEAMANVRANGLTGTVAGRDMLATYMRCVACGEPTSCFLPAEPSEVPLLANLSPIVIPKK